MKFRSNLFLLSLLIFLFGKTDLLAQKADLILTNGKIFTSDTSGLYKEALAIKGNKILAVGNNAAIEKLFAPGTKRIDLKGRTVVPGFNDAHDHLGWLAPVGLGYVYNEMNPAGPTREAVLDSISRLVKLAKPDQWIHGFIGNTVFSDNSMRHALDSIAPDNPVVLLIWWGHGQVVNKRALEAAGLSDNFSDPVGGWYIRQQGSNKIVALHQNAQPPVWNAWLRSEPDNLVKGLQDFAGEQLQAGITTVQQMSSILNGQESFQIFKQANLPQRIRIIAWPHSTPEGRKLREWDLVNRQPSSLAYVSGIKYVIDGTPLEGNALRTTPYNEGGSWYGRLNYPVDTMKQIMGEALAGSRQLMMHITADSSFKVVLSLMQQTGSGKEWKSKRVRIEHNCVGPISDSQKEVLKDFGVMMMHTPKYCMASPLRSLLEKGVAVGIAPDGTTNPFVDILMVTTMQADPKENLTREQAVIAYTKTNAYAEFAEKQKGTLAKGMLADLAVLSQDIFTIPNEQLPATQSVLTIVDGKIVYIQPKEINVK